MVVVGSRCQVRKSVEGSKAIPLGTLVVDDLVFDLESGAVSAENNWTAASPENDPARKARRVVGDINVEFREDIMGM
jgi:hypothetical protein